MASLAGAEADVSVAPLAGEQLGRHRLALGLQLVDVVVLCLKQLAQYHLFASSGFRGGCLAQSRRVLGQHGVDAPLLGVELARHRPNIFCHLSFSY